MPVACGNRRLLLAGAGWYALLSLLWSALSPQQAVRQALARLFKALAGYLDAKAALFTPVHGVDRQALQLALAMKNQAVVRALNDCRLVLIDRIQMRQPRGATAASLRLYFMAQDIHERVSSAHYDYDALAAAFFHSDVLFRCEHLLRLEAGVCRQRAEALRLHATPAPRADGAAALDDLRRAVAALSASEAHTPAPLRDALRALLANLGAIHHQLADGSPHPGRRRRTWPCRIRARARRPRSGRASVASSRRARCVSATRCGWHWRCCWVTACCTHCIRATATGSC